MNKIDLATQSVKLSWPSPQDYNEALQHPAINLSDPLLKVGKPSLNKFGLPKAITGSFASVYYLDCPERDYAIRCFLHNIADQRDRYAKISEYLNQIALPIMADFDYVEKGILTQSNWYPVLKMDWVDGQNLIEYIGRNLDNPPVLEDVRQWLHQARKQLADNGIAHADLQHGNVLVTNDSIKLVDYDGMYVPSLMGCESNELGHRNYQHPGRTKSHFGPYLDNFSAWLIDTCLFCLERDPGLWFDLKGGEDCLLFREKDLQDPFSSVAFHTLENHPNKEIQDRVRLLRWYLTLPIEQVPDLNDNPILTGTLPQLIPSAMKPDWLSSAQYLQCEAVPNTAPIKQARQPQERTSFPTFPLGRQLKPPEPEVLPSGALAVAMFFIIIGAGSFASAMGLPWWAIPAVVIVAALVHWSGSAENWYRAAEDAYRTGVLHYQAGNLQLADKYLAEVLNNFDRANPLGMLVAKDVFILLEIADYFLTRRERILAKRALDLASQGARGNHDVEQIVQGFRDSMRP